MKMIKKSAAVLIAALLIVLNIFAVSAVQPVGNSGCYVHDPMENPKAAADIIVDSNAVYGYAPNPDSTRLGVYAQFDWSDEAVVAEMRQQREEYHESIKELYQMKADMEAEGKSVEEIARSVSNRRNEIRMESYKDDPDGLEKLKESNLATFGNENGGTPEYFYNKYGSWEVVIEKAFSTNAGADACLGLYDKYYDTYINNTETTVSHRPVITDVVTSDIETNTYYFYMPQEWKNTFNDSYDGKSIDSCTPGIYWWDGDCKPDDNHEGLDSAWPGYVIKETLPEDENIFVVKVPKNVSTIIFNNTVDAGENREDNPEKFDTAKMTGNIISDCYSPADNNVFYPNGVETFDKMIYVCAPFDNTTSEYSTVIRYKGEWFYYYGGGKYGYCKTLSEAQEKNAVFSGGEFPVVRKTETKDISNWKVSGIKNKVYTGKALKQENIIVSKNGEKADFRIKYKNNLNAGKATVTITGKGKYTGSIVKTFLITKAENPLKVKAKKSVKAYAEKKTIIKNVITVSKAQGKVTFKTNNKKVTVKGSKFIVAKGLKKGKKINVKVTVTAKSSKNYKSGIKKVTVKILVK